MKTHTPKLALVLGGGGARGLAHIGVLKALEKNNIKVDLVVGTSMGAFVGGFYAAGISVYEMEEIALSVDRVMVAKMLAPGLSSSGFVDNERIRKYLKRYLGELNIEQLQIPFASIATDLITGEEVIIDKGSLVEAIMASIAIPALFQPVYHSNRYLIDGGLTNPLPVSAAKKLNAKRIIAVNIAPNPDRIKKRMNDEKNNAGFSINKTVSLLRARLLRENNNLKLENEKESSEINNNTHKADEINTYSPNAMRTLMQSVSIVENSLITLHLKEAKPDVMLSPKVGEFDMLAFYKAKELIACGEEAALNAYQAIQRILENIK